MSEQTTDINDQLALIHAAEHTGKQAFRDGYTLDDCPYSALLPQLAFRLGWTTARARAAAQEQGRANAALTRQVKMFVDLLGGVAPADDLNVVVPRRIQSLRLMHAKLDLLEAAQRAEAAGVVARSEGKTFTDCSYVGENLLEAWRRGWERTDNVIKMQATIAAQHQTIQEMAARLADVARFVHAQPAE